jgi:hypothetical protein
MGEEFNKLEMELKLLYAKDAIFKMIAQFHHASTIDDSGELYISNYCESALEAAFNVLGIEEDYIPLMQFCIMYENNDRALWGYKRPDEPYGGLIADSYYELSKQAPEVWQAVTKAYYYGWITSMKVGAYDDAGNIVEIGTVSSGLTEELEADAAQRPWAYLNKVVKLAGMEKDREAKTLRHFYFKGFHEDKNPEDCRLNEIF